MRLLPERRKSAAWLWLLLPVFAIGGWWYPYLGFGMLGCMLLPVVIALARGRHWCGWLCPRGAFFDYIMSRVSRNRSVPGWMRNTTFRIGALGFLLAMLGVRVSMAWPNPEKIAQVFILLLGVTTVVGIVLALRYTPRAWCMFCPMGTMAGWASRGRRPLHVAKSCKSCGACDRACPMALSPYRPDAQHADCITCTQCVNRCPVKALSFAPPVVASKGQITE